MSEGVDVCVSIIGGKWYLIVKGVFALGRCVIMKMEWQAPDTVVSLWECFANGVLISLMR